MDFVEVGVRVALASLEFGSFGSIPWVLMEGQGCAHSSLSHRWSSLRRDHSKFVLEVPSTGLGRGIWLKEWSRRECLGNLGKGGEWRWGGDRGRSELGWRSFGCRRGPLCCDGNVCEVSGWNVRVMCSLCSRS